MTFPLFHRPGTVVFLDDDPDYLEMLALVLPRQWNAKLFLRPQECLTYLHQEPPFWEADSWNQQQIVEQWRAGKPLIPQILAYWSKYTERYALAVVCVFDYSMPAMDGITALGQLSDWPGSRVLLTGQADEQIAVDAFNRGLIDQFIAKQTPEMARRLVEAVKHLFDTPNPRHAQLWRATLNPEQNALLRQTSVSRELAEFAGKQWVEHITIGDPFGVLGMDSSGKVSWLQLETPASVGALAELAAIEGVDADSIVEVRAGRVLPNLEMRQAFGRKGPVTLKPSLQFGDSHQLLGALFEVDPAHCPDLANSYQSWLARQERRTVIG